MSEEMADGGRRLVTLDDLIDALDKREKASSNVPKVETFHFKGDRVSDCLDLVEQALAGLTNEVRFQRIMRYVLHSHHQEVGKVVDAANGSWARFGDLMRRKYSLGDGLLTMADLEAMNKEDFSTIGAFVHEFKKKARKVHGMSEEAQCAIFLGSLIGSEASELTSHGGGSEKLTWATIDKGVEEGSLDQVEEHQVRLQRRKRKERDVSASGTPRVKKIVTDVLAALGYDDEAEVRKKGVIVAQGRASGAMDGEAGHEDYGREETGSQILTKAERKQRNLLTGGQGSGKGQAPQAVAAPPPTTATAPASAGPSHVGPPQEPSQAPNQAPPRKEPEPGRRKEVVEIPEEEEEDDDEEDERLRQEEDQRAELRAKKRGARQEAEPSLPDSVPKRKKYAVRMEEGFDVERMVDKLLEGHNDLMNLKDILASAPRLRARRDDDPTPTRSACGNYEVITYRNTGPGSGRNRPNLGSFTFEESENERRRLWEVLEEEDKAEVLTLSLTDMNKAMEVVSAHDMADPEAIKALREKVLENPQVGEVELVRLILRVDPTTLVCSLKNYTSSDPTVARWLTYILMFNFELERIPRNKNRADGLSRINWDGSDEESIEDTPPVDGFLDQEEDIRLHINEWSLRVPSCVSHPIRQAPKGYEQNEELILKPFQEEDPWGSKDFLWMMKLALAGTHSLVEEVRTIEEGPTQVEEHEQLMGGMYLLTNTLLQRDFDRKGTFSHEEDEILVPVSQDDEFKEGEIKEAFRAEEYDGIYRELGLLLSCEMRDRDASVKAQKMRHLYVVRDDHLFIKRQIGNPKRIVCGRNRQIDIIAALHDGITRGHKGISATCVKISELYHWDGMLTMVIKYCRSCIPCQERSGQRPGEPLHPRLEREVGAVVHLDLLFMPARENGCNYIFDARDNLIGFVDGRAIRTKTGPVLANCIEEYYLRYPFVKEFVMDRGSEFTCNEVRTLLAGYGVVANYTTAAHPQANAPVERGHSTITNLLAKWTEGKPGQWPKFLRAAFFVENVTVKTTKYVPATLWYGRHATFPIESFMKTWRRQDLEANLSFEELLDIRARQVGAAEERLREAAGQVERSRMEDKMRWDQMARVRKSSLAVGDVVLLYDSSLEKQWSRKLDKRWMGPYRILRCGEFGAYPIEELDESDWQDWGASGGDESRRPFERESTPVFDDDNIEIFLDSYQAHAAREGWSTLERIRHLRGVGRFEEAYCAHPGGGFDLAGCGVEDTGDEDFTAGTRWAAYPIGGRQRGGVHPFLRTVYARPGGWAGGVDAGVAPLDADGGEADGETDSRQGTRLGGLPVSVETGISTTGARETRAQGGETTEDDLRGPSPTLPEEGEVVPLRTPLDSLEVHLDASQWGASQLGADQSGPARYEPVEDEPEEEPPEPGPEAGPRGPEEPHTEGVIMVGDDTPPPAPIPEQARQYWPEGIPEPDNEEMLGPPSEATTPPPTQVGPEEGERARTPTIMTPQLIEPTSERMDVEVLTFGQPPPGPPPLEEGTSERDPLRGAHEARARRPSGETKEEKHARVRVRLEGLYQEKIRMEATGEAPKPPIDPPTSEQRISEAGRGTGLFGWEETTEPPQQGGMGKVFMDPIEVAARREAEEGRFSFRTPTKLASQQATPMTIEVPEGEPTQRPQPPVGEGGPMEESPTILLEVREGTLTGAAASAEPEAMEGEVSRFDELVAAVELEMPPGGSQGQEAPERVPEMGELRTRLGSWATGTHSGEHISVQQQEVMGGSATAVIPQPSDPHRDEGMTAMGGVREGRPLRLDTPSYRPEGGEMLAGPSTQMIEAMPAESWSMPQSHEMSRETSETPPLPGSQKKERRCRGRLEGQGARR
ncbi:GT2-family glycosyltransferase [Chara braunii]|uniref:GT2-family glycosyltransferase n=1 Tax=Chara braunii TaxID=69332 RepID=A0A388LE76_CHABU|nr:GT2-family glycosyltransferase [Chara braunii]|eukprot:GBG80610.1 GT2-family glycosyltransferase [Chara braunii]